MHPQEQDCFFFCLLHRCCNGSRRGRRILSLLEAQIHIWCEILQKEKQNSVVNSKARTHTHARYLVGEECMLAQHDCLECLRSVKEHTRHADDVCPPHRSVSAKRNMQQNREESKTPPTKLFPAISGTLRASQICGWGTWHSAWQENRKVLADGSSHQTRKKTSRQ